VGDYLASLALTWAVEVPLLLWVLRRDRRPLRCAVGALLASGITHPLLWFAWPHVVPLERYELFLATGEGLVVAVEALVLWGVLYGARAGWLGRAALASTAANAASLAVGLLRSSLSS
jgi:hypothetical protein